MPGIAITDADGFELTDAEGIVLDESCASECPVCGAECFLFARFEPCTVSSPDPACDPPPGAPGVIYICNEVLCTADSPYRPGEPFPPIGLNLLVIWYEGRCWQKTGGLTRPELPPDAVVIEAAGGGFRCMGQRCNDNPDCGTLRYAEAVPCEDDVPRPWPLYCPAGLPFRCSTINPADHFGGLPANWNNCFTFDRDAPVIEAPPGTPILTFPANGPWVDGRTCCQCNCTGGPPIPHLYCPGFSPGGYCCPPQDLWDAAPLSINAVYRIDTPEEIAGFPGSFSELYFTSSSTAGAPTITVRYRISQPGGGIEEGFNIIDGPIPRITCPLNAVVLIQGVGLFPQAPQFFDTCTEARRYDRWSGAWTGRNDTGTPGVFRTLRFNWNVRVAAPQPPGCSNENCSSRLRIRPPVGQAPPGTLVPDGGGGLGFVGVSGEGCSGCGDGMGWG